jgi:integrase
MPNRISITQLGAERLRAQPKEVIYWDTILRGFGLRVSPMGRKSFLVQYRVRGPKGTPWKERQVVLGTLQFLTVAEARARAGRYKAKASEGVDPVLEIQAAEQAEVRKRSQDSFTFGKLVERYTNEHLVERKPAGRAEQVRLLKRWLPILGNKPVSEISEADLLAFINSNLKGRGDGRAEADHLVGVVRHVFTWARKGQNDQVLKGLVVTNPAADIARWAKPAERKRYLTHAEITKLWAACEQVGWPGGKILQLLLLTGQRVNEVARMPWSELDLPNRTWHLPAARAKNSRGHIVHLNDLAMEIINDLPRIDNSPYVFTIDGSKPCSSLERIWKRIHRLMGGDAIPYWQLRDLRRTAATLMAELRIDHHIIDKILNHASGKISGVMATYIQYEYLPERQAALEALGQRIEQLIGRSGHNVIQIRA